VSLFIKSIAIWSFDIGHMLMEIDIANLVWIIKI